MYLEGFGFGVEVVDGRHPDISGDDAKGGALKYQKLVYGCRGCVRKPDLNCISETIADQAFEGC